jgi:hypothetical protein
MIKNYRVLISVSAIFFGLGLLAGHGTQFFGVAEAQSPNRVFELRTYTAAPGRLGMLHARFAEHITALFERHGMTNIGYFSPQDAPLAENTLIYLLAHDSRAAAEASWTAFRADPEWRSVNAQSQADGPMVEHIESVFLDPTAYSPMK